MVLVYLFSVSLVVGINHGTIRMVLYTWYWYAPIVSSSRVFQPCLPAVSSSRVFHRASRCDKCLPLPSGLRRCLFDVYSLLTRLRRLPMSSSTQSGSSIVEVSPSSSKSSSATLRRKRRMILPERVSGKARVNCKSKNRRIEDKSKTNRKHTGKHTGFIGV